MLDERLLRRVLPSGRFGAPLHVYQSIGSTNDRAAELATRGAPEGTVVLAGEQTAGRGRRGRSWDTPAGAGLAISVVLRPPPDRSPGLGLIGALAVVQALTAYQLRASVKWPNDVLLERKKVAGVLAEADWSGSELEHVILGIGINLRQAAADRAGYDYPATALEEWTGRAEDPNQLIGRLMQGLEIWYQRYLEGRAHPAWEQHLAFLSEQVAIHSETGAAPDIQAIYTAESVSDRGSGLAIDPSSPGTVLGLTPEGGLRLELESGAQIELKSASARIRPLETGLA